MHPLKNIQAKITKLLGELKAPQLLNLQFLKALTILRDMILKPRVQ